MLSTDRGMAKSLGVIQLPCVILNDSFPLKQVFTCNADLNIQFTSGDARLALTFLILLRVIRRFPVIPAQTVIASEAVDVRHSMDASPYDEQSVDQHEFSTHVRNLR